MYEVAKILFQSLPAELIFNVYFPSKPFPSDGFQSSSSIFIIHRNTEISLLEYYFYVFIFVKQIHQRSASS